MKNYASIVPEYKIDDCSCDQDGSIFVALFLRLNNVSYALFYSYDPVIRIWRDNYTFPRVHLTEKCSYNIAQKMKHQFPKFYLAVSNYSVIKFQLLKVIVQNSDLQSRDILFHIVRVSD